MASTVTSDTTSGTESTASCGTSRRQLAFTRGRAASDTSTTALANEVRRVQEQGVSAVVLVSEAARPLVKGSTLREVPQLAVLSVPEVVPDVTVEAIGEISV